MYISCTHAKARAAHQLLPKLGHLTAVAALAHSAPSALQALFDPQSGWPSLAGTALAVKKLRSLGTSLQLLAESNMP